jgi:hypothetical protein
VTDREFEELLDDIRRRPAAERRSLLCRLLDDEALARVGSTQRG